VLGTTFPVNPPIALLDEPINEMLFEFIDYLKPGNFLDFNYLHNWKTFYNSTPAKFDLQQLLI
jgi:hypothetical protein